MCAINPKHKRRFFIDVYTSVEMSKQHFDDRCFSILCLNEMELNEKHPKFRFHLKETEQPAE